MRAASEGEHAKAEREPDRISRARRSHHEGAVRPTPRPVLSVDSVLPRCPCCFCAARCSGQAPASTIPRGHRRRTLGGFTSSTGGGNEERQGHARGSTHTEGADKRQDAHNAHTRGHEETGKGTVGKRGGSVLTPLSSSAACRSLSESLIPSTLFVSSLSLLPSHHIRSLAQHVRSSPLVLPLLAAVEEPTAAASAPAADPDDVQATLQHLPHEQRSSQQQRRQPNRLPLPPLPHRMRRPPLLLRRLMRLLRACHSRPLLPLHMHKHEASAA